MSFFVFLTKVSLDRSAHVLLFQEIWIVMVTLRSRKRSSGVFKTIWGTPTSEPWMNLFHLLQQFFFLNLTFIQFGSSELFQIRSDVKDHPELYSLIYTPHPVVVPGGRFRELYYWWVSRHPGAALPSSDLWPLLPSGTPTGLSTGCWCPGWRARPAAWSRTFSTWSAGEATSFLIGEAWSSWISSLATLETQIPASGINTPTVRRKRCRKINHELFFSFGLVCSRQT